MSVILDMNMPKNCADCKLTYLDTGDDAYEYRCVINNSVIDCNSTERDYGCHLKSVDDLIKQMERLTNDYDNIHYESGVTDCINIVENFFEVGDNEDSN